MTKRNLETTAKPWTLPAKRFAPSMHTCEDIDPTLMDQPDPPVDNSCLLGLNEFKSWDPQMNACVEELTKTSDLAILSMMEVTNARIKAIKTRISILEDQNADILACCRKVDYCYAWIKSSGTKLKPVLLYKK